MYESNVLWKWRIRMRLSVSWSAAIAAEPISSIVRSGGMLFSAGSEHLAH